MLLHPLMNKSAKHEHIRHTGS